MFMLMQFYRRFCLHRGPGHRVAQAYDLCSITDITLVNVLDMSSKYILYIDNALKYRIAGGVFVQLELVSFLWFLAALVALLYP